MEIVKVTACLKGLKRHCWRKNLSGFFEHNGKPLTDKQVRDLVNWGIEHGCETEADIPPEELPRILFGNKIEEKKIDKQLELF